MDIATPIGLIAGAILVVLGIAQPDLLVPPLVSVYVIGGGIAVLLVAHPLTDAVRLPAVVLRAIRSRPFDPRGLIERIVYFSETARREGILALEKELAPSDPPLLQAAMRLAVDGTEPDLIADILETELRFVEERHTRGRRLLHDFGIGMGLFGLVGGLLALWQGSAASVVVLPLLYGATLGGLVCWPLSRKLGESHEREALTWRMTVEGTRSIQSGDNPRIVEHKLAVFLAPALRPTGERKPVARPALGPDDTAQRLVEFVEQQRPRLAALAREAAARHEGSVDDRRAVEAMADRLARGEVGVVQLLGALGWRARAELLEQLRTPAPPLLARASAAGAALSFADLARLADREVQTLLREVDQKDCVLALKGADDAVRDRLLSSMSERVRTFLTEEMSMVRPRPDVVIDAQARILAQVYQLAEQGQLALPAGT